MYGNTEDRPGTVFIKKGSAMMQIKESNSNKTKQNMNCEYIDLILFNHFIILPLAASKMREKITHSNGEKDQIAKKKKGRGMWKKESAQVSLIVAKKLYHFIFYNQGIC